MKNKCEICRCLLFEADVWWVLPKSNQLFPWGSSPYSVTPEQLRNMKRWSDSTLWNCEEDFVLRGLCYGKIKTELSQSSLVEDTGYRAVFFFFLAVIDKNGHSWALFCHCQKQKGLLSQMFRAKNAILKKKSFICLSKRSNCAMKYG